MSAERLAELEAIERKCGALHGSRAIEALGALRVALAEIDRLRAEVAARQEIVDDLRALVREAEREPGGVRVPWHHELAGALRMPNVVRWARGVLRRCDEPRREDLVGVLDDVRGELEARGVRSVRPLWDDGEEPRR